MMRQCSPRPDTACAIIINTAVVPEPRMTSAALHNLVSSVPGMCGLNVEDYMVAAYRVHHTVVFLSFAA